MAIRLRQPGAQVFKHGQLLAAGAVLVVTRGLFSERVVARERGGEDHTGVVSKRVGQSPAVGQLRAFAGGLVTHHQWNACVTQCVEPGRDGQLSDAIQRRQAVGGNPEFLLQIKGASAASQFYHIAYSVDGLERWPSVVALNQARDVFVEYRAAETRRDHIDELLAA